MIKAIYKTIKSYLFDFSDWFNEWKGVLAIALICCIIGYFANTFYIVALIGFVVGFIIVASSIIILIGLAIKEFRKRYIYFKEKE